MCQLKSGIIMKGRVFVPEYDSHSQMLEELWVEDNYLNASKMFVRVELSPEDGDPFTPIDEWKMRVDQDIVPDWWNEEEYKPLLVERVKVWAQDHIYIGIEGIKITGKNNLYLKNCKNICVNSSTVKAYGSSTVKACDYSTVEAYGSSTVEACDYSTVEAYGSSTVEAYGSSTVKACDSSTVIKTRVSNFDKDSLVLSDNSTFKDCSTKTIYQSGDWKLVAVNGEGKI